MFILMYFTLQYTKKWWLFALCEMKSDRFSIHGLHGQERMDNFAELFQNRLEGNKNLIINDYESELLSYDLGSRHRDAGVLRK